jgi:succinyl-CoA:acetate CoA-transferase
MALDRIRHEGLRNKVVSAAQAAALIQDGMNVSISGFALTGNPKEVLPAMVREMEAGGEKKRINLWTGASTSYEADGILAAHNLVMRRFPYQSSKEMRQCINRGDVQYTDMHLSLSPQSVRYGWWGHLDVAIIEAALVTEAGEIVLTTAVGNTQTFAEFADIVILEVNDTFPEELEGFHDLYAPIHQDPPIRDPIPLTAPHQRIGTHTLQIPLEKIQAIVLAETKEKGVVFAQAEEVHERMAGHLIEFLEQEIRAGRMPSKLLPLQSGVGNVANAVLAGLAHSSFENLQVYSEVLQDSILTLLESGKLSIASGCALNLSEEAMEKLYANLNWFKQRIILRPLEITNHPEIIRRLGIISMNTALEVDIYGNVNSTHVMGTRMMNGIGGSGDFTRNAYLSFFLTESTAKQGAISSIVPFVSHIDHTEHDVGVVVTEQGAADLRGLSPRERAVRIIEKCAHPDYREPLMDYFARACQKTGGQTPHLLDESFSWHTRFIEKGTMKQE